MASKKVKIIDQDEMEKLELEEKESKPKKSAPRAKVTSKKNSKKKSSKQDKVELSGDKEKVEALTAENDRLRDQMLRARAEFENYKRRRRAETEQLSRLANEGLIEDILPVLDDFELFLKNAEKENTKESLLEGARMIRQKLFSSLEKRGLEKIDAKGKVFDPEWHEALLEIPQPGVEPGTIIEVQQEGYRLGQKLIRPSRVILASEPPKEN